MMSIGEAFASVGINGIFASLYLFTPLWAPQIVFGKPHFNKSEMDDLHSSSFSLSDGFILFANLALWNSLLPLLRGEQDRDETAFLLFAACVNLLAVFTWFKCQRFLNSWRIKRPLSRGVMQMLLYPLSFFLVAEVTMSVLMLLLGLQLFLTGFREGLTSYIRHPLAIAACTILGSSLGAVFLLRSWFRHYIAPKPLDLSPEISADRNPVDEAQP